MPSFLSAVLSHSQHIGAQQPPAMIMSVVCSIIKTHLLPVHSSADNEHNGFDRKSIAIETLGLLDSLCWNTPDEFQERYSTSFSFNNH
jgi:hypothetical protein